jgi:hypothetical protein
MTSVIPCLGELEEVINLFADIIPFLLRLR